MKFYRYEIVVYASYGRDMEGEYIPLNFPPRVEVELREYNLHKETPKGYWIGYGFHTIGSLRSNGTWVSKTAKKRYAYPTKEEAMQNFIKRTERRAKILRARLDSCEEGLAIAKKIIERNYEHNR